MGSSHDCPWESCAHVPAQHCGCIDLTAQQGPHRLEAHGSLTDMWPYLLPIPSYQSPRLSSFHPDRPPISPASHAKKEQPQCTSMLGEQAAGETRGGWVTSVGQDEDGVCRNAHLQSQLLESVNEVLPQLWIPPWAREQAVRGVGMGGGLHAAPQPPINLQS